MKYFILIVLTGLVGLCIGALGFYLAKLCILIIKKSKR